MPRRRLPTAAVTQLTEPVEAADHNSNGANLGFDEQTFLATCLRRL
jgi:hypothetical protein